LRWDWHNGGRFTLHKNFLTGVRGAQFGSLAPESALSDNRRRIKGE